MVAREILFMALRRQDQRRRHASGIVDEDVDTVGQPGNVVGHARRIGHHRQVGAQEIDPAALRRRRANVRLRRGAAPRIAAMGDDVPALPRQSARHGLADARAGPCHDCRALPVHALPSSCPITIRL